MGRHSLWAGELAPSLTAFWRKIEWIPVFAEFGGAPAARFGNRHALLLIFLAARQPTPGQVELHDHSAPRLMLCP